MIRKKAKHASKCAWMLNSPNSNRAEAGDNKIQEETNKNKEVPLHMSPVTDRAGSFTGRILSVQTGNGPG